MIPVAEAQEKILAAMPALPSEVVSVADGFGRVLAADVVARVTQPPTPVSAMDGYAVRGADVETAPATLTVIGEAPAGHLFDGEVGPGQAVRIFTGGAVPEGADTIVIQEDVDADGASIAVREATKTGTYVRPAGLDFQAGNVGLAAGRRLSARDVGLAAAMNVPWLSVRRRPRVALLATGDEIVRPGEPIDRGQIVSSNTVAMAALVRAAGAEPVDLGIAKDNVESLETHLAGTQGCDMLVTLGGASVGDHDLVRDALEQRGWELGFWQIAMRPGKPLMFGHLGPMPLLGMPGNPVSSLVCGLLFVQPAIRAMLGISPATPPVTRAVLGRDLRANDRREDYLRSTLLRHDASDWVATPFERQDSSMLSRLAAADCLVIRPPHAPPAKSGDNVAIIDLAEIE